MADNEKKAGSDRTNISEQSLRSLSASVGSLAQQIRHLTSNTARMVGRGAVGAARNVGGAMYDMRDDFGINSSNTLAMGVSSAVSPFAGQLVKKLIDRNEGSMVTAVRNMAESTASMVRMVKDKVASRRAAREDFNDYEDDNSNRYTSSLKRKVMSPLVSLPEAKKRSRRSGNRMTSNSFVDMYGSATEIEALDRLRISNARWLKALGTLSKSELKRKPLPKARQGGYVSKTGKAIVHEGEAIVPAEAIVGQYAILKEIRDNAQEQTRLTGEISATFGSGESMFLKGINSAIENAFSNSPLMKAISTMAVGIGSLGIEIWRFKAISGPAFKYTRLVYRRTPFETIAQATANTYGELRYYLPKFMEGLNNLLMAAKGRTVATTNRGNKAFGEGTTWMDRLKRFAVTGDVFSMLNFDEGDTDVYPDAKKGRSRKGKGIISSDSSDLTTNRIARNLSIDDPGAAQQIRQTSVTNRILKDMLNIETKSYKADMIDTRDESHYQSLHAEWLRKNPSIGGTVTGWLSRFILPGMVLMTSALSGIAGFFGLGAAEGVKGFEGAKKAYLAAKNEGTFARFLKYLKNQSETSTKITKAVVEGEDVSKIAAATREAKAASTTTKAVTKTSSLAKLGAVIAESKISQSALSLLKSVPGGTKILRGLGVAGKVASSVALPLLILTSIVDGLLGWFKAGKIFEVAEPTIRQRFAAMGGGILDGLFEIIRLPINLFLKMIGSDSRIPTLINSFSVFVDDVMGIIKPMFEGIGNTLKFIWKGVSLIGGLFWDFTTFVPRLLIDPKKTIEDVITRVKNITLFLIDDIPNFISDIVGNISDSFFKFAEMGKKWFDGIVDLASTGMAQLYTNWKEFWPEMINMFRHAIFKVVDFIGLGKVFLKKFPGFLDDKVTKVKVASSEVVTHTSSAWDEVMKAGAMRVAAVTGGFDGPVSASDVAKQQARVEADRQRRKEEAQKELLKLQAEANKQNMESMAKIQANAINTVISTNNNSVTSNNVQNQQQPFFTLLYGGSSGLGMGGH